MTITQGDVDEHETRVDIMRQASRSLFGNRKLYGAIGGLKMSPKVRKYAIDKGFFVIGLTGSTTKIDMPEA
jgi:hypothetical protein